MKHIYFFFAMLFAAVCAMPASAQETVTFTVNIDDAAAVTVVKDYSTPVEVITGDNVFSLEMYSSLQISAANGYAFASITNDTGTPQSFYDNTWYISYYGSASDWDGKKFFVKTINLEASRTASFTMTVDDPTKVSAQYGGTSANLTLLEGTNTYKFNPEVETTLYLMSTTERNIYSVKVDGVAVSTADYTVEVPLTEGCNVKVEANYPDIPVTVTIEYDEESCPGLVTSYSINYASKGAVIDNKIEAQAGDNIQITVDNNTYKLDNVTINGTPYSLEYFWGTISLSPGENTTVKIEAHPYAKLNGIVNIEIPEAITLYGGYQNDENIIPLQKGRNEVGVSEKVAMLAWKTDPAYKIVSVTDGQGNAITGTSANVQEGFELTFVIEELVLDKSFVFWVDDKSAAAYYFRLSNSERNNATLDNGYNIVNFTDSFNPYEVTWAGGASGGCLYVNDELVAPYYEGGTYWNYNFNDGDVAKAFVKGAPTACTVTFEAVGDPHVSVVRNIITEVADWKAGFTDFPGTQVNIAPAEGTLVKVEVDGTELTADEAGAFQFTVEGNTAVTVTELMGIEGIEAGAEADAPVYNLQGVKVGTSSTVSTLPAGLYISAGKKVIVK